MQYNRTRTGLHFFANFSPPRIWCYLRRAPIIVILFNVLNFQDKLTVINVGDKSTKHLVGSDEVALAGN